MTNCGFLELQKCLLKFSFKVIIDGIIQIGSKHYLSLVINCCTGPMMVHQKGRDFTSLLDVCLGGIICSFHLLIIFLSV